MGFSNVFLGDSHAEIAPLLTGNPNRANFIAYCLNGFLNKDEQINFWLPGNKKIEANFKAQEVYRARETDPCYAITWKGIRTPLWNTGQTKKPEKLSAIITRNLNLHYALEWETDRTATTIRANGTPICTLQHCQSLFSR